MSDPELQTAKERLALVTWGEESIEQNLERPGFIADLRLILSSLDALEAAPSKEPRQDQRDRIARIIDEGAFLLKDHAHGGEISPELQEDIEDALRKADAILSELSNEGKETGPVKAPEPPWPVGPFHNSKRAGWAARYEGRAIIDQPFPPARHDLAKGFKEGWLAADAALSKDEGEGT